MLTVYSGIEMVGLTPLKRSLAEFFNLNALVAVSKTLHQQNPSFLNWRCQLTLV